MKETIREQFRRSSIDAAHFLGLAHLYAEKGENNRAQECLEVAKAKDLANPAHHKLNGRILFRRQQKEYIVTLSNNLALIGMFLLAVSMCGAIALISDFIFGAVTAIVSTIVMAAAFIGFWFAGPIIRRANLPPRRPPG